jgi:hypothetical protein
MKKYLLVSCFERELLVFGFKTFKEAFESMKSELEDELGYSPEIGDGDDTFSFEKDSSWLNTNRGNFDWKIVNLEDIS